MKTTIGERGQVTIPKRRRDPLRLHAGADRLITRDRGFFRRCFTSLVVLDPSQDEP